MVTSLDSGLIQIEQNHGLWFKGARTCWGKWCVLLLRHTFHQPISVTPHFQGPAAFARFRRLNRGCMERSETTHYLVREAAGGGHALDSGPPGLSVLARALEAD